MEKGPEYTFMGVWKGSDTYEENRVSSWMKRYYHMDLEV